MNRVHICHPLSGFTQADKNKADMILRGIKKEGSLVVPYSFTFFKEPVEYQIGDKTVKTSTNLVFIASGVVDEVWVYGPIDEHMEQEIHLAYAKRIYIRCKDEEARRSFERLGLFQKEDRSEIRFWVLFTILSLIIAIVWFIFFRYTRTL